MQIYLRIIRSNISEKFVIVNYKYEIKHRNYLRTRIELRFRFRLEETISTSQSINDPFPER